MKKLTLIISILAYQHISPFCCAQNYTQYVNPMIGTGDHGHTFPGATTPFGMVQLSPDTRIDGSWDGCSGYYHGDSIIYGFSHTHLSGTGCSDYGDIAFLPTYEEYNKMVVAPKGTLSVSYSHKNEKAEAGYYSVLLDNGVKVELTSTPRVGLQKYTYTRPIKGFSFIELNLLHRDELLEGSIHQISKTHFSGIRRSKAWAENQVLFYDFEISKEPDEIQIIKGKNGDEKLLLFYGILGPNEQILIKTGISACDEAGALNNRTTELPGWDFEKTKKAAQDLWNKELGKIDIDDVSKWPSKAQQIEIMTVYELENINTPTKELPYPPSINFPTKEAVDKATIFYTALYHCMIHPSLYSDVDNRYRGRDNKIHNTEGKFDYYTVFSLWDTYRALHPLFTIIDTKRTNDFINTFLCQYKQGGLLPVWELSSNETNCMIGYHSVSVIWDAYSKGIRGYDANLAYEAMKHSAMQDTHGLKAYKEKGYISSEDDNESVSKTLEYAYDDWCIGQMAKALGKTDDYNYFEKRGQNWKNLFNPETGFFQAKKNGSWVKNFDPYEVNNNYTEANAWQYSVSVPHDLTTLNSLYKGGNGLQKHLDELFSAKEKTNGRNQADISGLIGQYAHGNEPSHHLIYCYGYPMNNYQEKKLLTKVYNEFYKNAPDGLIGNEDCGQMSAWYVMSAMSLYAQCPGQTGFATGVLAFQNCTIYTSSKAGKIKFFNYPTNQEEALNQMNGISTSNKIEMPDMISYEQLMNGGEYEFQDRLVIDNENPIYLKKTNFLIAPYFNNPSKNFTDSFRVEIKTIDNSSIFYSLNGKDYLPYKSSFVIKKSCTISAYVMNEYSKEKSAIITSEFRELPSNRRLKLLTSYDNLYTAGGDDALIDLERGNDNWRIGNWQGYAGKDFVGIVDVGSSKKLKSIGLGCLQDQGAWVMMPPQVIFEGSNDGKTFEPITTINTNVSDTINHAITKDVAVNFYTPSGQIISSEVQTVAVARPYRYYKVTAKNYGKLPQWHWSKGEPAWLFVDEIIIVE
jgi:putative alpha-1,2-mannosidase